MRILFSEVTPEDEAYLRSRLPGHEFVVQHGALDLDSVPDLEKVEVVSVMVHSPVRSEEMARLTGLRMIATRSTGYDHIDLAGARDRGVTVSHVPAYGSNTVAEHTFALVLALSRRVPQARLRLQQGDHDLTGLMGFDLAGKTLGVVGAGRIGLHVVRIGNGFGMRVLAFDPYLDPMLPELLEFESVGFETLLEASDVVAVCCPLTDETRHLFDDAAFALMRKGAILVNTARGAVVEAAALLRALDAKTLAGAGLDVLEGEDLLGEDSIVGALAAGTPPEQTALIAENLALMRHPDVIVTPHMAFYSREALRRILDTTADNITAFEAGRPINLVPGA